MRRHPKAPSAGSTPIVGSDRTSGRRLPLAFLGALVLACTIVLGTASAIADTPPSVTIDAPTEVSYTTAHVSGTVNPEGGPSSTVWHFETSTDPSDPSKWEPQYSASGEITGAEAEASTPVDVGGSIYLASSTKYSVRLVAENEGPANRSVTGAPYPSFTTLTPTPPAVTIDAPSGVTATTAHFSGTVDPGGSDEQLGVHWYFQCEPECPGLEGYLAAGSGPVPVSANATGLQPNLPYKVSLVASNNLGLEAKAGPETFTTPPEAPFATTIGATLSAGGTSATVGGRVNPRNSATTYWIEYGSSDSYGQSVPATKDAGAGSGGDTIAVSQALSDLTPETTYHYRVVAKSAVGTTVGQDLTFKTSPATAPPAESCPNQALRVGLSAALPDCRAYEMVSPSDKEGSNAYPLAFTPGGERVRFYSTGAFAGAPRGGANQYLATRAEDGWVSKPLTPGLPTSVPNSVIQPEITLNQDGSETLVSTVDPLVPADTNHAIDYYLIHPDGSVEWITRPTANIPPGENPYVYTYTGGATDDLSHILLQQTARLVPAAAGLDSYAYGLYEWANGGLRLVNVDSHGELLDPYGAGLGAGVSLYHEHAISRDGERIFFTSPADAYPAPPPFDIRRIYLRESDRTTTEISATQCTEVACEGPPRNAVYQGAAVDGSVAFFTSEAQLTNGAASGGGLYRYTVGSGELKLLAPDVEGVLGNSDDGSLVYFVSTAKLAPGAAEGSDNLYLLDTRTNATTLIAMLEPSDAAVWSGVETVRLSGVTPSGDDLVFSTAAPLAAGYDNAGHKQIYRYDLPSGELTCVSCVPGGSPAQADALFSEIGAYHANASADGKDVFFQTSAALLPQDKNGKVDVYEWHDGTVSLISSGTSPNDSSFVGTNSSGRDALFSTWEPLVPRDIDGHRDAYDARVDGGSPESSPPPPTPCSGEGCRGSGTGPGAGTTAGTVSFVGADGRPAERTATLGVGAISKGQAKRWAKTGLLSLRVKVPAAGRVRATARARLGKKTATVAAAATAAKKAGTVSLPLKLSKAARSYLDRRGRLPVTITVTYSKSKAAKQLKVTLVAPQPKQANGRGQR